MTPLPPERIDSILGSRWVIRRAEDHHIEYSGFTSLAEAVQFIFDQAPEEE